VCETQQPSCFWALNDVVRYTAEELIDVSEQYAISEEVARPLLVSGGGETVPSSSRAAPSNIAN
jgi:hypothetical protein